MTNGKFLLQIRHQMERLKAEYAALSEAYRLLTQAKTGRGRKPSLDFMNSIEMPSGELGLKIRRKGQRGRPPGAKNKPGYKKPGPKPKVAERPVKKAAKKKAK